MPSATAADLLAASLLAPAARRRNCRSGRTWRRSTRRQLGGGRTRGLTTGTGQMNIPVKLLANGVDQDRVGGVGKLIDPLCPERDSESHQQRRFDEHDRKLQVRRDSARDPFVVSDRTTTTPKTNQDVNKK